MFLFFLGGSRCSRYLIVLGCGASPHPVAAFAAILPGASPDLCYFSSFGVQGPPGSVVVYFCDEFFKSGTGTGTAASRFQCFSFFLGALGV